MDQTTFVRSFFRLVRSLISAAIGRFFRCLPRNLIGCELACLSLAVLVWMLLIPKERLGAIGVDVAAMALFVFYGAVGSFWGLQRALDEAASEAIRTLELESPAVFDRVLTGIVDRTGMKDARISLEEVRRRWDEATEHLVWTNTKSESEMNHWSLLGHLANRLAKESVRRRTVIVTVVVDSLLRNGETYVSATAVKELLRDRMVHSVADMARSRMSLIRCCSGVVSATLMALPVVACWLPSLLVG